MSESDHALAEILEWFSDLEAAIPGVRSTVGEILIGKIPESDIDAVYELSDAWGAATEELAAFYQEAVHAADGILENWSGDGAADVFTREWLSYLQSLAGTVDTLASMEEAVQSFGLQIELMKFMALIGLIMLAVSLFMLVAAAIPSLGLSTAGIPGAFAACRAAIGAAATNAVRAIGSISVRAALAEVTALLTRTLPTLVRTQLPAMVRTQVPRLVTTQLPRFARTQVPAFVRQTLPTLARQGAGNLARGVLPRNVIARSVADRMAGQWLRGVTNRELLRQLGREAGLESRRLAGRSLLAARNQLAREIEEQLLRKFGARVGTDLAARGGIRLAGTEAFEQLSRATLSQYATREIAATTFGRELTKYLGQRVAFGTAFMGGGNLLGQMYQIAGGERTSLDLGQLGMSTVQGGIFGASMFGGIPGHIVGGGLAGGLVTGVTDAAQGKFDLQNMLHGGAEGAKAGAIFGAQNRLDAVRVGGMDLRIGRDVMVLPEGMAAVDRAAGLRVTYSERGAVWAHVDGDGQRLDGGAIAADGSVLARDGVRSPDPTVVDGDGPTPGGPRDPHPPRPELPPADLPQRTDLAGGTGDGGGGGPRQPAHPAPVRTPEAGTRLADPARPPADPVRAGDERTPGEWSRPGGDRVVGESTPPTGERTGGEPAVRPTPADAAPSRGPVDGGPARPDGPPPGRDAEPVRPDVEPVRPDVEPGRRDVEPGRRDPDDASPLSPAGRSETPVTTRDDAAATVVDRTGPSTDPTGVTRADLRPDHLRPEDRPAADRPPQDPPPEDRGAENRGPEDRDAQTGVSIRPRDEVRAWDWAERAYDRFRADDHDLPDIARHLAGTPRSSGAVGFSPTEIRQVKRHLMVDEHLLDDYEGGHRRARFDANPDIAEAWIRLREGRHLPEDLVLLEHELTEAGHLRAHPDATYREAHDAANARYNWESIRPGRVGEDLHASWGEGARDGDPAGLRTGPGRQTGGGIHLRVPDDGPPADHPEGHRPGQADRRPGGRELRGGVREDPAVPPQRGTLAPQGQLRGVAPAEGHVPVELVPAGSHPIGPSVPLPEAVRSTFDGHIGELLAGREVGPVDQPHRASWDESSRLLTVEYPDGLQVGVVLQVNSALPPGQPVVLRPGMAVEHGQWVQRAPAGVVLPDHLPVDPTARTAFVGRQLGDAWRTLHREIHQVLDRPVEPAHPVEAGRSVEAGHPAEPGRVAEPERTAEAAAPVGSGRAGVPADGVPEAGRDAVATPDGPVRPAPARAEPEPSLAALEQPGRPDPPVLDVDAVGFRDATAPPPVPPRLLTPDTVRGLLTGDPAAPGPLRDWAREHLAVRQEDGSYLPRSQAEIDAVVAWLRAETTALVTQRIPADPNAVPPAVPKPADPPAATPRPVDPDAATRPVDPDAVPPRHVGPVAVGPVVPAGSARAGDELPISQELAPSSNFPAHRTRTGAELPEQVHELVGRAKENLLARYPEAAVAARLADLDAVGRQADRLQLAADRARDGGPLGDVVREVRALSRAVDGYADRYRDWRDFSRGGEHADPGWRDLDGVDPLHSVEMAHRVVSVDPVTHRFHVIDQAIAVAKIGDVLGPAFERHAAGTFERLIPKDPASVEALLPPELRDPELNAWIGGPARGGFDTRTEILYVDPRDGATNRPISAVAATVVHESMHRLQPSPDVVGDVLAQGVAEGRYGDDISAQVLVPFRFEGEFQAFAVQQHFLRGLAGFRVADHGGDPRLPRSDAYQEMADWTPQQMRDYVLDRYVLDPAERAVLPRELLDRAVDQPVAQIVERARLAIAEANHPIPGERRGGTFHGPLSREIAARHGLDLDAIGQEQSGRSLPALLDRPAAPDVSAPPRSEPGAPPLAEWGPPRDGGPADRQSAQPGPERRPGVLGRALHRITGLLGGADPTPGAPERGAAPRPVTPEAGTPRPGEGAAGRWAAPERAVDHQARPPEPGWPAPEPDRSTGRPGAGRGAIDAVAPDGRTLLGLTERRCVVDELRAATDPIDQARLREDLHRLDADLARRGYPVHELEQVPQAGGAAPPDGREHARNDEIWSDPPWRQEDRRPSLDELIPGSREEADAWGGAVRREFADQLDGREFAGLRIRVDLDDPYSVSVHRNEVVVRAAVHDPDGVHVGRVVRAFHRDHDGSLFVEHVSLRLSERVQGQGFAREWNGHLTDWYRYSGVERVELHAASTVGGYAWARDGFDWAPNTGHRADGVLDRLRGELRAVDVDIALARRAADGDGPVEVDRLRTRYGTSDPEQVLSEAYRQREAGREILDRARSHPFGSGRYPTPFEISQAGWGEHHRGRDASWIGKRALLGADWKGVKSISDTGPLHPRSAYTAGLPRVPDPSAIHGLLSGGGHPPVTAARVPDAQFHGYGREVAAPELVRQLGDEALRRLLDRLPADSPLHGVRLDLTAVPADALPDGAVARSVPVDTHGRDLPHGTVAPDGGGWRIELSDRAADVAVARAVAHEAAELAAIRQRVAGGLDPFTPDALTPGALPDGVGPSPHDLGRLAEVEVLADLLRDPAQATYARTELRALRDHLGLHPDDPGAAARLRLLGGRLSDAGRDALLGREGPPGGRARPPTDGPPGRVRADGPSGRTPADVDLAGRGREDGTSLAGRDREGPGPAATDPAPTRAEREQTRAERASATWPALVSRVPFEFARFLHDPRWSADATLFEQRLGAYYFRDPQVLDTVRTALTRMRDILVELTGPAHPGETRAEVVARVEGAFFRDDEPASAGQVGTSVGFDRLLAEGNLRETMTAFYNAAYCNWKNPHTLSRTLLTVLDEGRWEQAREAGLDVAAVRRMGDLLDGTVNRLMPDTLRDRLKFGRDFFATGNVARNSPHGLRDLTEMTASQYVRRSRSAEEQAALANTPDHYARWGAPLGRLERAYVDQVTRERGDPLGEHSPLPWREGITAHDTDHGPWARWVGRDGFPVVDGVSGTTARMLTAARFVGLDRSQGELFLSGLMGWMLPARDHSLFEILRGAEIAGVPRVTLRPPDGHVTAVDLYRSLPDVDLPTLRAEVTVGGLFPHEARYLEHAVDPHGFSETQHKVPAIADRLWPQLASGQVHDADLAGWLRRNGLDPADTPAVRELGQRLSKPHVMALAVYTRHSHYLINNVIRTHLFTGGVAERPTREVFDRKVAELVRNYLGNIAAGTKALPLPLMLRAVVHEGPGHLTVKAPLSDPAGRWVQAQRRLAAAEEQARHSDGDSVRQRRPGGEVRSADRARDAAWSELTSLLRAVSPRLFDETRWHADMVHDAMMQLPAVGSPDRPVLAYRGDWITPVYSPIYGNSWWPTGRAREFLSVSRRLDVAVRFMAENPAAGGKILVVYRLTGQQARDISVFSSFAVDEEAVFPPHSRMRRTADPGLAEQVRAQLPAEFQDNCEIIIMEEMRQ
ncbi:hypothetical protein GA0070216_103124 [Micromonospora matsumotoense]|uniref:Outer membrane channel protein CpnT-like N-terminal domain-containing protein n=1 Tax=Micromonospora matsumotoense TaxID=121616 RepID=A0A1C4W787_9ACTN|nr:hypothetical protein [Micromonospora matsumotoense]SCE91851.1 hypothetical protein GA0070216_103124 [Micromonospora matsumotoense]